MERKAQSRLGDYLVYTYLFTAVTFIYINSGHLDTHSMMACDGRLSKSYDFAVQALEDAVSQ